jgi:hypothetical protein
MRTALLLVFVVLAMAGSFFAGQYLHYPVSDRVSDSANEIFEEARGQIPKPELPAKPSGHTVTTMKTVETHITVPTVQNNLVSIGGFLGKITVPQVVEKDQVITTQVPVTTLVDATPEEIKEWNEKTKTLSDEYEAQVREKANEIAEYKSTEKRRELIQEGSDIAKNMIVPVVAALAGLIGSVAALRAGTKAPMVSRTNGSPSANPDHTG